MSIGCRFSKHGYPELRRSISTRSFCMSTATAYGKDDEAVITRRDAHPSYTRIFIIIETDFCQQRTVDTIDSTHLNLHRFPNALFVKNLNFKIKRKYYALQGFNRISLPIPYRSVLTAVVRTFAQRNEVDDVVVHFKNSSRFSVHDRYAGHTASILEKETDAHRQKIHGERLLKFKVHFKFLTIKQVKTAINFIFKWQGHKILINVNLKRFSMVHYINVREFTLLESAGLSLRCTMGPGWVGLVLKQQQNKCDLD
ncbi:hypothetical protein AGLY_003116 [Aphis glycines]|uniref:Uncharacterized protein n=1 Tax=Aphis glycines TaxID=307491 RepID=A0A6G0U282_APHGL|nr:hypothetical protein AGLY_003116 [Aphis glycines]